MTESTTHETTSSTTSDHSTGKETDMSTDTGSTQAQGGSSAGRELTPTKGSEHGRTTIADTVVSKIAGIATREVEGVYDLGGTTERAIGLLRERIPVGNTNLSQGVSVEVGQKQAAVDLQIIAEYGVSIADLATGIRRNVISSIERMTGLEVTEVNIAVNDIHIEDDDAPATTAGAAARDAGKDDAPVERRVQ
ncbi:Asp23/Gls24 family envelope stress response protein [Terracoccus luteus]|uniref:Putative alkaline shock family protein YloU n=1 Tax=Terracoccus luteus TaxID=53356 RepID=A0A495XY24_9MICO|nr:Asp23/Gls24 family envelope stress response protein [Terracoccus luteus]MBB2988377.1 putative alkaline shock family protein YloU [Terracoccus luteus]MCP2173993.1 putative alkaline shock family protein YloU [Terracoccus luteus]RKT79500.1 putative alkaline shock family protein YloU [Terracoccus luteus]